MEIQLLPDPEHFAGGYAVLQFTSDGSDVSVELMIRDLRKDLWLTPGGWRTEQSAAGVFEVIDAGGGWRQIRLRPDVVDQIDPDSYLEIRIRSGTARAIWPDSIHHSPQEVSPVIFDPVDRPDPVLTGKPTTDDPDGSSPVPESRPKPPPQPTSPKTEVPEDEPKKPQPKRNPLLLVLLVVIVMAAAAYLAWQIFGQPTPPEEEASSADCSEEGFRGRWSDSFEDQFAALGDCLGEVSGTTALRVLDSGVAAENPDALYIYAQLYDGTESTGIPVTFEPNLARATEYYARAKAAGKADAAIDLERVCTELSPEEDLLHESVFADYCR